MAVAVKPSNSLLNIRSGIKSIKNSFSGLRKNAGNLNDVVLKKTKVKRESIVRNAILSQRRQEQERRKNKEDLLEASTIGGAVKRQAKAVASSTKGFLGRIMDFLGTLLVGWLLTNLPSIITMAQELIARIQRLYTIVTGFFNNTIKMFRGFGNLLGAVGKNILTFDFTDSKGRVESALKDLGGTFDDMQSQFDEGFKLLTTSLGEGVVSGEDAQPFGTQYENESMQEQPSGGTSGGGTYSESSLISAMDKGGITDKTERAMFLAQMRHESGNFKYDEEIASGKDYEGRKDLGNVNPGDGVRYKGRGYIQLTGRANYRTYGKKIGVDLENNPELAKRPDIAAAIALAYWNSRVNKNAARSGDVKTVTYNINGGYNGLSVRQKYFDDYVKKGIPSAQTSPKPAQTTPTPAPPPKPAPIQPGKRFKVNDTPSIGRGVNNIVITDLYGSRGGTHKGLDIAAPLGTYIALRYDCEVVATGTYGRYGLLIDVWVPQLKVQLRMSHLSAVLIKSGRIKAGTSFARVGQSGRATGPHIHFEYDTVKGRSNYGGSGDPSAYVSVLLLTNSPNQGSFSPAPAQITTPTPAQITPSGTQQRRQASQQLARQPAGPSIIIIEEEPPAQQPQGSIGGGGAMMIPIVINPLNSFITKKLLLDLAYT
jgi:predicted chitinase